jgi:hypothetical protein
MAAARRFPPIAPNAPRPIPSHRALHTLAGTIRDTFGADARQLTDDREVQALLLDAYVSC